MKEYKRLQYNLDILEKHNEIHTPVFHLTDGKTHEQDLVRELIADCRELLNKIENGTLIELPCKVGDKVYYVNEYRPTPRIEEYKVYTFTFDFKHEIVLMVENGYGFYKNQIFLTRAEAEKKLKDLKK